MAVAADDDVIVQFDAERAGDGLNVARHLDVGLRWCWIAGRMIVDHSYLFHNGMKYL